jgi:hypothetical protein
MLNANCRTRFTADDFEFVVTTLSRSPRDAVPLAALLTDEETRNEVLDHDALYRELLDNNNCLKVSPSFYFYVLVRRVLLWAGINDRHLADYLGAVLVEFGRHTVKPDGSFSAPFFAYPYLSDLLLLVQTAGPWERLLIRAHMGDTALFIGGIFADRVRAQCRRRGSPDLSFYDRIGQGSYLEAAESRLADETDHRTVFNLLGHDFRTVRRALNHLSNNVLHLSQERPPLLSLRS